MLARLIGLLRLEHPTTSVKVKAAIVHFSVVFLNEEIITILLVLNLLAKPMVPGAQCGLESNCKRLIIVWPYFLCSSGLTLARAVASQAISQSCFIWSKAYQMSGLNQ